MEGYTNLFEPYRALGLCSSHVPHCTRYHKKHQEYYVFTAVGKVFHTYNCSKLGLTQVSNRHPAEISCIAADGFFVYTGCEKTIRAFQHNRHVKYVYEGHQNDVHLLLPFSDSLISVDKSSHVKVWHIKTQEIFLHMEFSNDTFQVSALLHPSTYVNKLLFGSKQGTMQLWNIRKTTMLYEFFDQYDTSSVLCLVQSPAVDVIAVGKSSGQIRILNIKVDQTIIKLHQNESPVTRIAFRTDGEPTMVTSDVLGNISVWDLEEKRLCGAKEHLHESAIAGMTFIPGQPLLMTNSSDNSIKIWSFNQSNDKVQLLRCRAGHSEPPTKIKFYEDDDGSSVVSAGLDSTLRVFSTVSVEKNKSFGQASLNRSMARRAAAHFDKGKLPPIVDFCSKITKEREWDNIIAFHEKNNLATTWNYRNCVMGSLIRPHSWQSLGTMKDGKSTKKILPTNCFVTAVTLTDCGNFCLIGYSTGNLDMYNIQSKLYRGSFVTEIGKQVGKAHATRISGIAVNMLNQVVVSTSMDETLKFWQFKNKSLLKVIKLHSIPSTINLHGENSLVAVTHDDFSLKVFDLDTRKIVRCFDVGEGAITDTAWSTDGHWLIVSSMDCTIRTFELSSASLIDCFVVDTAAISVALSPNSELLASCHVDDLGIYLWFNCSVFGRVEHRPLPSDFCPKTAVEMPQTDVLQSSGEGDALNINGTITTVVNIHSDPQRGSVLEPLDESLVTLSLLPQSRWANLLSLDIIKKRNKPDEPPTLPKSAPFFLPTIASLNPTFDITENQTGSKIKDHHPQLQTLSELASIINDTAEDVTKSVLEKLRILGPSAIEFEIRSLSPEYGGAVTIMVRFLSLLRDMLKAKRDFELIQSYLGLFMKVHTELVASESALAEVLKDIEEQNAASWTDLRKDVDQCVCLLNHMKATT